MVSVAAPEDNVQPVVRKNLRWNFVALSFDYGLYGLGLALSSVNTVLPAFAQRLGASNVLIGAIPAIQTAGWALPALLFANYTERLPRKMPFVLAMTIWERLPYLVLGGATLLLATQQPTAVLALTMFLIAMMAFAGGAIMPAWMEVVAKVIPVNVRGRFFAVGNIISGLTGLGGAALVGYFLANYAFPTSYALCFFASFAAVALSFTFLSLTREHAAESRKPRLGLGAYLRSLPGILRNDRNFSLYLLSRALGLASVMGNAFFTAYALKDLRIAEEQVAVFSVFLLIAQTISTALWGLLADRNGHKVVMMLGMVATILSNAIALFAWGVGAIYLVFFMMGTSIGAVAVSAQSIVLEFASPDNRPTYVGLNGTILAPISFFAPLFGGYLADTVGYSAVFTLAAALALGSLTILATLVREPRGIRSASSTS